MNSMLLKLGSVLILLVSSIIGGYWYGKKNIPDAVVERIEVKGETRIEYRDKIVVHEVVKVIAPDGTITETVRDVEKETTENKEVITNVIGEKTTPLLAKYSLGLYAGPVVLSHEGITSYNYKQDWQVEASRRIVGRVWGAVLVSPFHQTVALGLRYEF